MPKVIDVAVRQRAIAEAVYRVIVRDGLAEATLGNVAAEAGLAIGSVRHYVGTHNDLLRLTLDTLVGDVRARLGERGRRLLSEPARTPESRRDALVEFLGELLPLDARRQTEAVVWIAFGEAARVDPELRPELGELYDAVRALVRRVLNRARPGGIGTANRLDALRLAALMNGLALDAVQVPGRNDPALMRRLLRRELDALLG